jgi:hypothetical protein
MKRGKKRNPEKRDNSTITRLIISIIFGLLMVLLMMIYSKYYPSIPIGYARLLVYNLTMLIPVIIVTLIGLLFNMAGGSISDFTFYIISFIIYSSLGFLILFWYKKIKPQKRRKFLFILFSVIIFCLLLCMRLESWRFYGT